MCRNRRLPQTGEFALRAQLFLSLLNINAIIDHNRKQNKWKWNDKQMQQQQLKIDAATRCCCHATPWPLHSAMKWNENVKEVRSVRPVRTRI